MDISEIMYQDHEKIEKHLSEFESVLGEIDAGVEEKFKEFQWELEKHFFLEEKAIFTFLRSEDKKLFDAVPRLEEEHDEILELLGKIREAVEEGSEEKVLDLKYDFHDLLVEHKEFENDQVYSKLNSELDEAQKKIIAERLDDVGR